MRPPILIAICAALPLPAAAADFPTRPIRLIVPFPPGGTTDILARLTGPKMTETFRQNVIIDNRGGASGMIGADAIAKALPDGHTIGIIISTHAIAPSLFTRSPFDPAKDFTPITLGISVANVISVHPSVAAKSIKELVALARAQPGKLAFGHAGNGTGVHLTGELFRSVAKVDITPVPYKGGGPSLADLVAGQIPVGVQNLSTIMAHARAGRIRPLGISSLERSPALPDLPTVAEQGYPKFEAMEWYGFVAPGGTPRPIITRLNQELVRILGLPEIRSRLLDLGCEIVADRPDQFGVFMKAELGKWSKLVKEAGIRLD